MKYIAISILIVLTSISIIYSSNATLSIVETNEGLYLGTIKNGKRDGLGLMKYRNGNYFMGNWKQDKYNGPGRLYIKEKDGWYSGKEMIWRNGQEYAPIIYQKENGNFVCFDKENNTFKVMINESLPIFYGNYENKQLDGLGIVDLGDEVLIGYFRNSKLVTEGIEIQYYNHTIKHIIWDQIGNEKVIYNKTNSPDYFFK